MSDVIYDSTTLNAFMDAVTNAYGTDVWNGITSLESAYTNTNFTQKVLQVPGVSAVRNNSGNILYYKYNDQIVGQFAQVGNEINSNVGTTIFKGEAAIPAETSIGSGNVVTATSGMKAATGGGKVVATAGKVVTAVGAVAAGIQLGAVIDGLLYNANPDFWDEHGMSSLNPETWDSLCETEEGKDFFNFVFGIDKNNNTTQAYMDEMAFAYIAAYMAQEGAFGSGNEEWDGVPPSSTFEEVTSPLNISNQKVHCGSNINEDCYYAGTIQYSDIEHPIVEVLYRYNTDSPSIKVTSGIDSDGNLFRILSYKQGESASLAGTVLYDRIADATVGVGSMGRARTYTYDNKTVIYFSGTTLYPAQNTIGCNTSNWGSGASSTIVGKVAWLTQYGNFVQTGVDGISKQDDATFPSGITAGMTIPEVLQLLKTQYPELWQNAIENDVIQDDGTIKKYTYVPVGIPDSITENEGQIQPTGGVDSLQDQTAISDQSPNNLIQNLIDILTNPTNPTQSDTTQDNTYPDTGEGSTPAIVVPTGSVSALFAIYNPSQAQIDSFGGWLWSNNFVDQLLKLFNDPMQAIIGLHKVFATPTTSGTGTIRVGYLDSGVSSKLVSDQYTEIDCGTVNLREYFGNVFDYSYTDIYLYLPFVGIVPLNVSDVMRGGISVKYKVDVLSGACLAMVNVTRDLAGGQLYTYSGNCAVQYPLSSGSYMGIVTSLLGLAGSVVGTIATGGAMLPLAIGAGASALGNARTSVQHSGALTGNAGAMGIKKPYLIIRRPQTATANNFDKYNGISYNEYATLSSMQGFTKVTYANLENLDLATKEEITEIEQQLREGVII